ncbi:ferredoxin-type protein NapG [Varunaivibrio sulfuroxidans]|uniref:Ferredoxin-type protein NapG n=1 Tax=Varunaivibrio sulfuroxidans TaxID=1773489 RepID=A0A4V2UNK8_9PROT|nr:ferredoxin-type protein NapG [Varunaivibrio sulfuroxidans]TCS62471.1 ferredoxin-type protein NapG [Varunaivibrio sulfuroxidans]WES30854.1 ferredoxin-type protein NapG [Varunaivibrio sulfuroxidans]
MDTPSARTPSPPPAPPPVRGQGARRRFLVKIARAAAGAGVFALALDLFSRDAHGLPAVALRPPGAGDEGAFLAACVRCGLCVRDCPYPTLGLARFGEEVPVGTPYFIARRAPCEMCEDIPCVKACPTAALDPELTHIDAARMGLAVLTDHETCLNFQGLRCDVCFRVCPLMDKAITLEMLHNPRTGKHAMFIPTVHSEACTGCGKCERACVLERAAIRVLPRHLVKGEIGDHYRLGWVEEKRHGGPLVPGLIDLPDRMPASPSPGGRP